MALDVNPTKKTYLNKKKYRFPNEGHNTTDRVHQKFDEKRDRGRDEGVIKENRHPTEAWIRYLSLHSRITLTHRV